MMKINDDFIINNNLRILTNVPMIVEPQETQNAEETNKKTGCKENILSPEERIFLWDVYNRPYVPKTERCNTITINNRSVSATKGSRICDSLVRKNLVRDHEINLGGRGKNTKFSEPTENGYRSIDMEPKKGIGRGADFEHGFWQYHVREKIKSMPAVTKITIEGRLSNNKYVDILIETMNEKIAVEVAMTADHEKINIEKDLEAGCDVVFIGCRDNSVLSAVEDIAKSFSDASRLRITSCVLQKLIENIEKHLSGKGD